jgi:hypothetical protein
MNNQKAKVVKDRQKKLIINSLYTGTFIIMFLGFFFSAYSVINNIYLKVLNVSVPGIIFGLLVVYFGLRYYFMVSTFKTELLKKNYSFQWSNFRRKKQVQFNNILK